MNRRLVIVGDGEHATVVADAARAAGWETIGCTRPDGAAEGADGGRSAAAGLASLGSDAMHAAAMAGTPPGERPWLVLGFGGPPAARRRAVSTFGPGATWATVVHPAAWVSPSATLAPGAVVLAGAVVNTGASVGAHAIVNSGAIVEHDVHVGDHVHVAPGVAVGGATRIGDDAIIGLGASVRDHVEIGAGSTIAMGAVVVADVPAGSVVLGVPARQRRPGGDGGAAR